jgi:hypothetical protein
MARWLAAIALSACGAPSPPVREPPPAPPPPSAHAAPAAPARDTAAIPDEENDDPPPRETWTGCAITTAELERDVGKIDWVPAGGVGVLLTWFSGDAHYSNSISIAMGLPHAPAAGETMQVTGMARHHLNEREGGVSAGDNVGGTLVAKTALQFELTLEAHGMLRGMFDPARGVVHHFTVDVATIHHTNDCK